MTHLAKQTGSARMKRQGAAPLERAVVKGSVQVAFWGLRVYIVAMLILVIVGFARGTI